MLGSLFRAPVAVWSSEVASLTFRPAWSTPLTWEVRPWAIAYPAASSAAELMRRPEDRRCIAVLTALLEACRLRWVSIAETLVRIERDISVHLHGVMVLGFVPRWLLAAGLSGYRPSGGGLEGLIR